MLLGYCFGRLFRPNTDIRKRNRTIALIGGMMLLIFTILRYTNAYGDPLHWSPQRNILYSFFSFINCQKYPPSLLYLCMTLGPALLVLSLYSNIRNQVTKIITVYGRVPFVYYLLHFYLIHTLSALSFLLRGHTLSEGIKGVKGLPFKFIIPGEGYNLAIVYLFWIAVVISLYPICKWFSEYRGNHKKWWLNYL